MPRIPALTSARTRLHAVAAGAAMAFIVGLSAPATSATGATTGAAEPAPAAATTQAMSLVAQTATDSQPATAAAAAPAAAAASPPAAAPKAPSTQQLHPRGVGGGQESFTPTAEQLRNARAIIQTGQKLGLPPRAWVIAVATSLQETGLRNLGDLGASNDHDSLGLFQQRPSSGWGTPAQVRDPVYASTSFYKGLTQVDGWDTMNLTDAAQAVQVSAYPDHYAKWESEAGNIVQAFYGEGPYAPQAKSLQ